MNLKKLALGGAILLAASQASAALLQPNNTGNVNNGGTGGGEMLLMAYNDVSQTTYLRDLGVNFNTMVSEANTTSLNFGADNTYTNFASGVARSDIKWSVINADVVSAGDTSGHGNEATFGDRILTTSLNPLSSVPTMTNGDVQQAATMAKEVFGAANTAVLGAGTISDNNSGVVGSGSANWPNDFNGNWAGYFHGQPWANPDQSMYFLLASQVFTDQNLQFVGQEYYATNASNDANMSHFNGMWSLNHDGSVQYSVSSVPLPAGVWLFASGLAGLAGISRRKKKA